ncbi:ubiquitin thioesterase otu1 [Anaeramoeba ignava]|uniref:Ubiquitin thioesterase OTU n=1 Tax=Anaeramoeba ignava TaxID=1746090 RepID=A0A9Q0LUQ7_ANAIG|nr:ubiquitin thioesterase otu1 [Anaeramoeba ignava]
MIRLRIRFSKGMITENFPKETKIENFSEIIETKIKIAKNLQVIKKGYPPKLIEFAGKNELLSKYLSDGDSIIVEEKEMEKEKENEMEKEEKIEKKEEKNLNEKPFQVDSDIPMITREDGVVIRREMPDDNSCLFHAINYAINHKFDSESESTLRKITSKTVLDDPIQFSEAILGKSNSEYSRWILQSKSWGGSIELLIFAKHFKTEISTYEIQSKNNYIYGENMGFTQKIFLVYDGLHYDTLALSPSKTAPKDFDRTIFNPSDSLISSQAAILIKELHDKKAYTDVATFRLLCQDCGKILVGEKEALLHSKTTGHQNFVEKK